MLPVCDVTKTGRETSMSDYVRWKDWDEGRSFGFLDRGDEKYFVRELRESLHRGPLQDVLEIGFGNGAFLSFARRRGWNVVGLELLPELVEKARAAGFDARPADGLDDLPEASFDLVVAFDVFEHIPPEQSLPFLRSLRAAVRPGGLIVLRFPNADTWLGNPFQNGDPTHVNAIGLLKLQYYAANAELDLAAFRPVSRRGFSTSIVHGVHLLTGAVLARVVAALARAVFLPGLPIVLSTGNVLAVLRRPE